VIGTGTMAPGIAAACASAGLDVTIVGRDRGRAAAAAAVAGTGSSPIEAGPIEEASFAGCDLVVETVLENLELKLELLARIEPWLGDDAVIATNTSSLGLDELASALARPERFAALHFLNPADRTAVVEVVPCERTAEPTIARLAALVRRMGKLPLVLRRDYPGFVWNRLQMAMIRECLHLLDEEVADIEAIEAAVSDGLAPRWLAAGPLATSDLGGPATFRIVAEQLFGRLAAGPEVSDRLGPGFYAWSEQSRAEIVRLRGDALAAGWDLATRRRTVTPPPT
jgi:3-hydroxybutyryl-CoA dehydrogenase